MSWVSMIPSLTAEVDQCGCIGPCPIYKNCYFAPPDGSGGSLDAVRLEDPFIAPLNFQKFPRTLMCSIPHNQDHPNFSVLGGPAQCQCLWIPRILGVWIFSSCYPLNILRIHVKTSIDGYVCQHLSARKHILAHPSSVKPRSVLLPKN